MKREAVTISMPPNMIRWVRGRVAAGQFVSVSDYFRYLVRDDQARERIEAAERRVREARRQRAMSSGTPRRYP